VIAELELKVSSITSEKDRLVEEHKLSSQLKLEEAGNFGD